jgi:glucose-6-phosphate isomerase
MKFKLDARISSLPIDPKLLDISHRIARKDATLWGEGTEALTRLGWVDLAERSRLLLPRLDSLAVLRKEEKINRVILSGMGGSSLAPEVIAGTYRSDLSCDLIILDSTEPHFVSQLLDMDPRNTLFVISSKSGTTIETQSHLSLIVEALSKEELDPKAHLMIITDPGSPLAKLAHERQWRYIEGEPDVGGRFSALSAFGLAPAALVGIDPSILLDDASEMLESIHEPAVQLASFLAPHRFLYFTDSEGRFPGLSQWIEQLIAESTGKKGKGLLPIAITDSDQRLEIPTVDLATIIEAPLGAQFILWEWVTALLGIHHGVDPFDQPDVQAAKVRTLEVLDEPHDDQVRDSAIKIDQLTSELAISLQDREYLAICAFLDPLRDRDAMKLRSALERKYRKPVSFGWGPRFLHSTGQFHKGGPKCGVFLSITIDSEIDLQIPGKDFGLRRLIFAQAEGDKRALEESGNLVISLHLKSEAELKELIGLFG